MKILILAHERTGSKMVLHNVYRYMMARDMDPISMIWDNDIGPWYEPIVKHRAALLPTGDVRMVLTDDWNEPVPKLVEYINDRLPIWKTTDRNMVVKLHHDYLTTAEELAVLNCFDLIIHLRRKDVFAQSLSYVISNKLTHWINNAAQREIVNRPTEHRMLVDVNYFRKIADRLYLGSLLKVPGPCISIWTEDIVSTQCPLEFSTLCGLEPWDFHMELDTMEYGAAKNILVSNIQELRNEFDKIVKERNHAYNS